MSLLTEQEIRDIARSVKEIGENSDRALILAAQKAVIEKIKAQGPSAYLCTHIQSGDMFATADDSQDIFDENERALWFIEPLHRLPKGE